MSEAVIAVKSFLRAVQSWAPYPSTWRWLSPVLHFKVWRGHYRKMRDAKTCCGGLGDA